MDKLSLTDSTQHADGTTAPAASSSTADSSSSSSSSLLSSGLTLFHSHHTAHYKSRWNHSLLPALLMPHATVALLNKYSSTLSTARATLSRLGSSEWHRGSASSSSIQCLGFHNANNKQPEDKRFPPPTPSPPPSLLPYYLLDGASVLCVDALQLAPHHTVMDLCAAPGGKSVAIAQALELVSSPAPSSSSSSSSSSRRTAFLHTNELQPARRKRLQSVLQTYLPAVAIKAGPSCRVTVTGLDATRSSQSSSTVGSSTSLSQCYFDRVLLDAPCSSDRHVLANSAEMAQWTQKRVVTNAQRQELILSKALTCLKYGGILVYSTCSLSDRENDQVIRNVLTKLHKEKKKSKTGKGLTIQVLPIQLSAEAGAITSPSIAATPLPSDSLLISKDVKDVYHMPIGEPTVFGWIVLPDQALNQQAVPDLVSATTSDSSSSSSSSSSSKTAAHGFGPLYICRLQRLPVPRAEEEEDDEEEEEEEEDDGDDNADDTNEADDANSEQE